MLTSRRHVLLGISAAGLAALAGCSSDAGSPSGTPGGRVLVHTTGPVWAAVARAVAGDDAEVTTTDIGPDQDPHSYEASAQDKLAFSKAGLILVNGGHYDEWAEKLVDSLDADKITLDAKALFDQAHHDDDDDHGDEGDHAGHDHENEHVFTSIPTAVAVAAELAKRLGALDQAHAAGYTERAAGFASTMTTMLTQAKAELAAHQGATVVSTEAVAGLLLVDLGIDDITPEAYVEQSETSDGPSVAVLEETRKLLVDGKAKALLVNAQTVDEASRTLQRAADQAGLPTVEVHETMPEGVDSYDAYMRLHIDALTKALA
ncbi:metal ABC transporter solute-binding protein, Zn/Mn family [Aestuariimicrobium ganziense]|uniref:metal ABC transporter solute-binding protein, Zn/Mn family n=1 Tax=Aestuariimicrobium ganziense TaxID=2773677 RepID=UPI0019457C6E|nr:zinc ABC transporter substrate-binding protein [Aestuariimicrobium ganziense]